MACSFPGVKGPRNFWSELTSAPTATKPFAEPAFDHQFFNLTLEEAEKVDPQERQLLQETWRCIEDAAVPLPELQAAETAVFVGATGPGRTDFIQDGLPSAAQHYHAVVANRIAYAFQFQSRKNNVDAICPTSIMAVHKARVALLAEKCDYAFAAGGNWGMDDVEESGNGVCVLLLQPLIKALAAGHPIYGIIRGTQMSLNHENNDQSSAWKSLIACAEREAGVVPQSVTYMEVQGVQTEDGDTYDLGSLDRAFRDHSGKRGFCRVGAQKSLVGVGESGAGIAGIIKILMMMRHKTIPGSAGLTWNDAESPLRFSTKSEPWNALEGPLRAGICSFGVGGVQGHAILESFSPKTSIVDHIDESQGLPFILSANTPGALGRMLEKWRNFAQTEEFAAMTLSDVCATLMVGRRSMPYRFGCNVKSKSELLAKLQAAKGPTPVQKDWGIRIHELPWNGMAQLEPVLNEHVRFEKVINRLIRHLNLDSRAFSQPVWNEEHQDLFKVAAGYAYLVSMTDLGFAPTWLTGRGVGSWVALCASGMLPIKVAAAVLKGESSLGALQLERPKLPFYNCVTGDQVKPFHLNADYLRSLIESLKVSRAELSRYLGKARLLKRNLSPFQSAMDAWEEALERNSVSWSLSRGDVLGRGSDKDRLLLLLMIKASLSELKKKYPLPPSRHLKDVRFQELLDLVSDGVVSRDMIVALLTGKSQIEDVAHEMDLRQDRLDLKRPYHLLWKSCRTLHEIPNQQEWLTRLTGEPESWSPLDCHNVVEVGLPQCASGEKRLCVTTAKCLSSILLDLWKRGADIQWPRLYPSTVLRMVSLPAYPFANPSQSRPKAPEAPALVVTSTSSFSRRYTPQTSVVRNAQILGEASLPPSEMISLCVFGMKKTGVTLSGLKDIVFYQNCPVKNPDEVTVASLVSQDKIGVFSKETGPLMETAFITETTSLKPFKGLMAGGVLQTAHLYENMARVGFKFGPGAQLIQKVYGSPANLFFDAVIPKDAHPLQAVLSACFQAPLIIRFLSDNIRPNVHYGPISIKNLSFSEILPGLHRVRLESPRVNPNDGRLYLNISAYNHTGQPVLEISDLVFGEMRDQSEVFATEMLRADAVSCQVN